MKHPFHAGALAIFLSLGVTSPAIFASGAFSPLFGDIGSAEFNKGKAIYSGRIGPQGCTGCHNSFDRSRLMHLQDSVAGYIANCQSHKPCYNKLSEKDRNALNIYFKRRYHL